MPSKQGGIWVWKDRRISAGRDSKGTGEYTRWRNRVAKRRGRGLERQRADRKFKGDERSGDEKEIQSGVQQLG